MPGPFRRAGFCIRRRASTFRTRCHALCAGKAEQLRLRAKTIWFGAESGWIEGAILNALQAHEALLHQIIPAALGRLFCTAPAANDQPIFSACQRDIKQPMFFLGLIRLIHLALGAQRRCVKSCDLRRPNRQGFFAILKPAQRLAVLRFAGGIGQNNDRRLQALGAMHGHDPHHIARRFRFAFYLSAALAQPMHKALQRWRVELFMFQRGIEQFIQRITRIRPKPRQDARAPGAGIKRAGRTQHIGEQAVWGDEIKPRRLR